jgi:C4-dicarboxylate transporter, DctM subunit
MSLVFVGILLLLALIGSPLFVIVGVATALAFAFFVPEYRNFDHLTVMVETMEDLLLKQEFLAIPLFIASGAIMTAGGIATRLVEVFRAALGWLPGGVAVAAVMTCMYFASISGSSPVTLIAVGSIMFPALVQSKYPENFSLGILTTAGSLGCLVPPSISMLIYSISLTGSRAAVSPQDLFLAGLIPAVFVGGLLAVYAILTGLRHGEREKFELRRLGRALKDGMWALLLPIVVLGGMKEGLFNPSEAGAVAAGYALLVTMGIYRELSWRKLTDTLIEAATLMGSLILIIVLAFGLNEVLTLTDVQGKLMALIRWMDLGPFGFMLLVNVVLIVLGALMDSISATLIFAPLLAPVAFELYGIDPLHFGIVFVVNMEIGYLMPPVATNLFVASALFKKPFGQVTRAVLPTLGLTCLALFVIMYVPTLSKAAVNWSQGKGAYEAFPWNGKPKAPEAEPVETEAGVVAPAKQEGVPDLSAISKKSMEDWDDEDEPAPDAGAAAPEP